MTFHPPCPPPARILLNKLPSYFDISFEYDSLSLISFLPEYGWEVIYWNMSGLSVATQLKNTPPPRARKNY